MPPTQSVSQSGAGVNISFSSHRLIQLGLLMSLCWRPVSLLFFSPACAMGNRLVRDLGIGSCAVQTERGHTSRQYEGTGRGVGSRGNHFS